MKKKVFATILVFVQFGALFGLVFRTSIEWDFNWSTAFIVLSFIIGLSALYTMKKSKFTISPIPRDQSLLVEDGLYGYIRHPMYLAVLLLALGFVWQKPDEINIIIYCILTLDLLMKLHWEEKLLAEKFEGYKTYQQRTKKLIPFVY